MPQVVIPMNGMGKRFVAEGYSDPKPFVQVWDDKRMIDYVVDCFPGDDSRFLFLCNPDHTSATDILGKYGTIVWVEYTGKGPVDTLLRAADSISDDEEVIVSYCDYGMDWNYRGFLADMREHNAAGGIACYRGFHPHHLGPDCYAYVKTEGEFEVREKQPFTDNKLEEWASSGAYYFRTGREMKEALPKTDVSPNGEQYVSMTYNHLPGTKRVYKIERMLQFGTPRDLRDYQMWADVFRRPPAFRIHAPGVTVLPMAGRGSRFSMNGYTTPKPFLPVNGIPMMTAALQCIPTTSDLRLVTLRENPDPWQYAQDAKIWYLNDVTDGQATTVMKALKHVSDETPLTVTACDNGAIYHPLRLWSLFEDTSVDAIVWAFRGDIHPTSRYNPNAYAWLDVDDSLRLHAVSVKKQFDNRPNKYCIIGTMFFRRTGDYRWAYDQIRERGIMTNGEYYVDNLLVPLLEAGKKIIVFPVDHYLCWGTPNDYETFKYWAGHFNNADRGSSGQHA